MLLFFIILLAFLAGTLLALALTGCWARSGRRLRGGWTRFAPRAAPAAPLPSLAEAQLEGGWRERLWQPALRRLARLGTRLMPSGASERLRSALIRAGQPSGLGAGEFAGLRVLVVCLCLAVALPLCWFVAYAGARLLLLLGLAAVIGLTLPDSLLEQAIRRRQAQIRRALPDVIDLLVVSVEAGMGLDGALAKVTEKMRGPLSEELARAMDEMRLGKTRGQALKDMAARLDMGEVKTFVAAVTQAEQLGTSIVQSCGRKAGWRGRRGFSVSGSRPRSCRSRCCFRSSCLSSRRSLWCCWGRA